MLLDEQIKLEQNNKQKNNEKIKKLFEKKYNFSFEKLKKQSENYLTDDGCIHYIDIQTNEIYSFNFIEDQWMQHDKNYQNSLLKNFYNQC